MNPITSLRASLEESGYANVGEIKDDLFYHTPAVRKLTDTVFDDAGLVESEIAFIDFKNVYANERAIPEHGWSIFHESDEGLTAVFRDGEPVFSLFLTTCGDAYKAGAHIRYADESLLWASSDSGGVWWKCVDVFDASATVSIIAMDFLYGYSLKVA